MAVRLCTRLAVLLLASLPLTIGMNLASRPAYACDCAPWSDTAAAEYADLVFVGRLADQDFDPATSMRILDFEVSAVYKGEVPSKQRILTGGDNGCGYEPAGAGPHLRFVTRERYGDDPSRTFLLATPCSPSRTLAVGGPDPALRSPSPPTPLPTNPVPGIVAIVLAGAALVGFAASRLHRRAQG